MSTGFHSLLAILGIQPFFIITGLAAIGLVAAICFGAARWQQPKCKVITLIAVALLILLAVFVAVVLILDHGARTGAPL